RERRLGALRVQCHTHYPTILLEKIENRDFDAYRIHFVNEHIVASFMVPCKRRRRLSTLSRSAVHLQCERKTGFSFAVRGSVAKIRLDSCRCSLVRALAPTKSSLQSVPGACARSIRRTTRS